ncbi:MAG: hypothetical protein ACMUFK_03645 [Thermoplasmatota archaeon]
MPSSERYSTARSKGPRKSKSGGIELDRKRMIIIILAIASALVLITALAVILVILIPHDVSIDVGAVTIDIDGDECNVSAEFCYDPDLDVEAGPLWVRLEGGDVPLGNVDRTVFAILDEEQFAEIVREEEISVHGTVSYRSMIGTRHDRDIDTMVDLSFLGEVLSGIEIENVTLSTRFPLITVVNFDLTAEMEREVNLYANNTEATISNGISEGKIDLRHLELTNAGVGHGKVEMPTTTLLALGLWGRNVTVEAWGLDVEFVFPFTT